MHAASQLALAGQAAAEGASRPDGTDYRELLERIPAVTYLAGFGESGVWHYVSPYIESMMGFTPEQWRAEPDLWVRRIHPHDRTPAIEEERASRATRRPPRAGNRPLPRGVTEG